MLIEFGPFEHVARRIALLVSRGLWPRIAGRRHVPRRGPLVVLAAHPGPVDFTLLASGVPRSLQMVGALLYLDLPYAAPLIRRRGFYAMRKVEIGFDEENVRSLERAAEAVRKGAALGIFPQGMAEVVGAGSERVAAMAQAPVLPVLMYLLLRERTTPRALVWVRRPMAPPAPDARSRRAFRERIARRLRRAGALRKDAFRSAIQFALLDDPEVWRRPSRVPRLCGRIARLPDDVARHAGLRARALHRGCRKLRCSPGDIARPPGVATWLAYAALWAPAGAGLLLCAPPLLLLKLLARKAKGSHERQMVRIFLGVPAAFFWGLGLVAIRWWAPIAALSGLVAFGLAKPLRRRATALLRVRRHGARLQPLLDEVRRSSRVVFPRKEARSDSASSKSDESASSPAGTAPRTADTTSDSRVRDASRAGR
jgi:1-acyl-sn-glycerol-3-phosphate acyltransferase